MTFTEDWFGPGACAALTDLAHKTDGVVGDVIEIGCWEGRSTLALADAVAPAVVHAVDTWEGSPGEISAQLAAERDVFTTFVDNVRNANITPHRMGWRQFADLYVHGILDTVGKVRFLHIDAEHTYTEVSATIDTFAPLMAAGGVMCGDDVHHEPIRRAVLERYPTAGAVASEWWVQF